MSKATHGVPTTSGAAAAATAAAEAEPKTGTALEQRHVIWEHDLALKSFAVATTRCDIAEALTKARTSGMLDEARRLETVLYNQNKLAQLQFVLTHHYQMRGHVPCETLIVITRSDFCLPINNYPFFKDHIDESVLAHLKDPTEMVADEAGEESKTPLPDVILCFLDDPNPFPKRAFTEWSMYVRRAGFYAGGLLHHSTNTTLSIADLLFKTPCYLHCFSNK